MSGVPPVFIPVRDLPAHVAEYALCAAAVRSCGQGLVLGAQKIYGIWRLYVKTQIARATLLSRGLVIEDKHVALYTQHPFQARGSDGTEIPSTRLTVGDVPISYSDSSIESTLSKLGVKLRSRINMERVRDPDGKLTEWITGRRIVWIELPKTPLPRTVEMGPFKAALFHREMKDDKCRRCFQSGHYAAQCPNPEVCLGCGQVGHRRQECRNRRTYAASAREEIAVEIDERMEEEGEEEEERGGVSDGEVISEEDEKEEDEESLGTEASEQTDDRIYGEESVEDKEEDAPGQQEREQTASKENAGSEDSVDTRERSSKREDSAQGIDETGRLEGISQEYEEGELSREEDQPAAGSRESEKPTGEQKKDSEDKVHTDQREKEDVPKLSESTDRGRRKEKFRKAGENGQAKNTIEKFLSRARSASVKRQLPESPRGEISPAQKKQHVRK